MNHYRPTKKLCIGLFAGLLAATALARAADGLVETIQSKPHAIGDPGHKDLSGLADAATMLFDYLNRAGFVKKMGEANVAAKAAADKALEGKSPGSRAIVAFIVKSAEVSPEAATTTKPTSEIATVIIGVGADKSEAMAKAQEPAIRPSGELNRLMIFEKNDNGETVGEPLPIAEAASYRKSRVDEMIKSEEVRVKEAEQTAKIAQENAVAATKRAAEAAKTEVEQKQRLADAERAAADAAKAKAEAKEKREEQERRKKEKERLDDLCERAANGDKEAAEDLNKDFERAEIIQATGRMSQEWYLEHPEVQPPIYAREATTLNFFLAEAQQQQKMTAVRRSLKLPMKGPLNSLQREKIMKELSRVRTLSPSPGK